MFMRNINFLLSFVDHGIRVFSDLEYQKRVWMQQGADFIDSYDESITRFLPVCEEIFDHPESFEGVDDEVLEVLKKLYREVKQYDDEVMCEKQEGRDEEILYDLRWHAIQKLAAETCAFFKDKFKGQSYERTKNNDTTI